VLRVGAVADASPAELAAAVGPTIERYLTGDIETGDLADGEMPCQKSLD
jgi:hypothetical protein